MTWGQAYEIADEHLAHWQQIGLTAAEAADALGMPPAALWQSVRVQLAAWAKVMEDQRKEQ